jgi:CTP synthase (UTP-ammonia lyase)
MTESLSLGIIGEYRPAFPPHQAIHQALAHAAARLRVMTQIKWLPTLSLEEQPGEKLQAFDVLWCAPGSPYQGLIGALNAIRFVREHPHPLITAYLEAARQFKVTGMRGAGFL